MAKYRAIYKCRLCGKIIASEEMDDEVAVEIKAKNSCRYSTDFFDGKGAYRQKRAILHNCNDGSFGLADFRGFRKVE